MRKSSVWQRLLGVQGVVVEHVGLDGADLVVGVRSIGDRGIAAGSAVGVASAMTRAKAGAAGVGWFWLDAHIHRG